MGSAVFAGIIFVIYSVFSSGGINNPPPGKVWSPEHGHWHDEPVSKRLTPKLLGKEGVNKITVPPIDKNKPPDGKVWDEEHGHFHDKE